MRDVLSVKSLVEAYRFKTFVDPVTRFLERIRYRGDGEHPSAVGDDLSAFLLGARMEHYDVGRNLVEPLDLFPFFI